MSDKPWKKLRCVNCKSELTVIRIMRVTNEDYYLFRCDKCNTILERTNWPGQFDNMLWGKWHNPKEKVCECQWMKAHMAAMPLRECNPDYQYPHPYCCECGGKIVGKNEIT